MVTYLLAFLVDDDDELLDVLFFAVVELLLELDFLVVDLVVDFFVDFLVVALESLLVVFDCSVDVLAFAALASLAFFTLSPHTADTQNKAITTITAISRTLFFLVFFKRSSSIYLVPLCALVLIYSLGIFICQGLLQTCAKLLSQ